MSDQHQAANAPLGGVFINAIPAAVKITGGIPGHSGALIADGITTYEKTMSRKKQIQDEKISDTDRKTTGVDINDEFPAVHVIGSEDSKKHFGSSAGEVEYQNETTKETVPKAEINLEIGELIWREAKKKASGLKMEISEYVEKALEQFNRER